MDSDYDRRMQQQVKLADGTPLPALRLGPSRFGVVAVSRAAELAALRRAVVCGYRDSPGALAVELDAATLAEFDVAFPPPRSKRPLKTT